ncbi:hypothetical protein D3C74_85700 [compost metagenome]
MKQKYKIFFLNTTIFLLSMLLLMHFFLVFLHAGPINPISVALKSVTDNYVGRFFQQNWHLFAPQPMTQNLKLYVRVKYTDIGSKEINVSEWYDVTEPMIRTNEETLFSPYNRIIRIGSGYIHQLYIGGKDELTYKLIEKNSDKEDAQNKIYSSLEEDSEHIENILYRYASAFAKKEFSEAEIREVQFMTSIADAVPYSKRNDSSFKPEETTVVFDWKGVVDDVVQLP